MRHSFGNDHPPSGRLACPRLRPSHMTKQTLEHLIAEYRTAPNHFTAYRNDSDGQPEPLCAIYPSGKKTGLLTLANELSSFSPRKLLIESNVRLISPKDQRSLDNVNTPEEFELITKRKLRATD